MNGLNEKHSKGASFPGKAGALKQGEDVARMPLRIICSLRQEGSSWEGSATTVFQ